MFGLLVRCRSPSCKIMAVINQNEDRSFHCLDKTQRPRQLHSEKERERERERYRPGDSQAYPDHPPCINTSHTRRTHHKLWRHTCRCSRHILRSSALRFIQRTKKKKKQKMPQRRGKGTSLQRSVTLVKSGSPVVCVKRRG